MRRDQTAHERLVPLLVEIIGAQTYLEIGTDRNQTINKVTAPTRIGVDPNMAECAGCLMFKMTCDEFMLENAAKLAPFDFVFIDADHSADSVRRDFLNLWPLVSADGLVVLHDTSPEHLSDAQPGFCGDAWKFVPYLIGAGHEACTIGYHPGLTLIRKRSKWGPSE